MWSLSHLIKGRLATHAGQRNRTAHSIAGEQWPETAPYPKTECFRNMLPLIFKTEKQRSEPLPLFSSPLSSQSSCFSLLPNAHKSMPDGNSQRPQEVLRGAVTLRPPGLVGPWVLCSWGLPASTASPGMAAPHPPALESFRGHPVIRCPSDVFTSSLTAGTSGAHIQVTPVPLDTSHRIISAAVMTIVLPPVIFKLHDRNSWS